jgi:hypothetical protein
LAYHINPSSLSRNAEVKVQTTQPTYSTAS